MTVAGIVSRPDGIQVDFQLSRSMRAVDQDIDPVVVEHRNQLFNRRDQSSRTGNVVDDGQARAGGDASFHGLNDLSRIELEMEYWPPEWSRPVFERETGRHCCTHCSRGC